VQQWSLTLTHRTLARRFANAFFTQAIDQHLRIFRARHAFGLTLDALDDEQKLRFVVG
jgi:hypothetical protein